MKRLMTYLSCTELAMYQGWDLVRVWKYGFRAGTTEYFGIYTVIIADDNLFEGI